MTGEKFDAQRELPRILESIGLSSTGTAHVEQMQGFAGGLNDGVWFVTLQGSVVGGTSELVLKLVSAKRKFPTLPTEVENLSRLSRTCPAMRSDPALSFPVKLLDCVPKNGGKASQNLIIMPKAPGQRLADWLGLNWARGRVDPIATAMDLLGKELRIFHERYGKQQHADFQPSNIFYDEDTTTFVFIDIGGIGAMVGETDQVHFVKGLNICAKAYGDDFSTLTSDAFHQGYGSSA
jgi:hypothetical protein